MENERIIIGSAIVAGSVVSAVQLYDGSFTPRTIFGAVGIALLLSLLSATGEGPGKLASGLALLTATSAVLLYAVPFFGLFGATPQGSTIHHQ